MRKEITIAIITAILSIILTSFIFSFALEGLDKSHRNFEYLQCEQFWDLAEQYVKTDYTRFDCNLILEYGVVEFKFLGNGVDWEAEGEEEIFNNRFYAYQDEVNNVNICNHNIQLCSKCRTTELDKYMEGKQE